MKKILLLLSAVALMATTPVTSHAQSADSPDLFVKVLTKAVEKGRPDIAWQTLPPSYRKDVEGLMHSFAGKMDPALFNGVSGLVKDAGRVLGNKKDLLLASPMMKGVAEQAEGVDAGESYDTLVSTLQTLGGSPLMDLDSLKTIDMGKFLAGDGSKLANTFLTSMKEAKGNPQAKEMLGEMDKFLNSKATTTSVEGDSAKVAIEMDGETENVEFSRVEGRWIPSDLATRWPMIMAEAKKGIAQIDFDAPEMKQMKMPIMMGINMGKGMLMNIDEATNQKELQESIGPVIDMAKGLMGGMMGGQ